MSYFVSTAFSPEVHGLKQNQRHRHDQQDAGAFGENAGVFRRQAEQSAGQK